MKPLLNVLCCIFIGSCAGPLLCRAASPSAGPNQALLSFESTSYVSPEEVRNAFVRGLEQHLDAGSCSDREVLEGQLKQRKTCAVKIAPARGKRLDPAGVFEKARPGTLIVGGIYKCTRCSLWHAECASGFALTEDGIFASNYHVAERMTSSNMVAMGIMTHEGKVFPVTEILAGDSRNDLAVMKAKATGLRPLGVATGIRIGEPVYSLSHPMLVARERDQGFFMFSPGIVSGKYTMAHGNTDPFNVLAVTCDYAIGSSGGPILDSRGAVVAVVCQAYPVTTTTNSLVQMVWHLSRPAEGLLQLVSGPKTQDSVSR